MKVAVIIPAFNAQATIRSAVMSLLRQTGPCQLEVIVVDDGSRDRTADVVADLSATHPSVRLILNHHGGISRARNAGLRALTAGTDLVSFLDADDLSPEGRFARDVEALRADDSIEFIYSKVRFFDREELGLLMPGADSNITDGRVVQLGAAVFRKQLLERVGMFDEALLQAEDFDYLLRTFELRPKYLLSDEVGVYYRKNHGGITQDRRQAQHELMKALLRARKRRAQLDNFCMPAGVFTTDHMADLGAWLR